MQPYTNTIIDYSKSSYSLMVSVIVVTYNQDWIDIMKTLDSIVCQENIDFEIIVCDDGSNKRFENELNVFFFYKGVQ